MNLLSLEFLYIVAIVTASLHLLLPTTSCNHEWLGPTAAAPKGLLLVEKIRLGSMPPSCYNRCNECSPCVAVKVPSVELGTGDVHSTGYLPSKMDAKYTVYKPLEWKCQCGDRVFSP